MTTCSNLPRAVSVVRPVGVLAIEPPLIVVTAHSHLLEVTFLMANRKITRLYSLYSESTRLSMAAQLAVGIPLISYLY